MRRRDFVRRWCDDPWAIEAPELPDLAIVGDIVPVVMRPNSVIPVWGRVVPVWRRVTLGA